jgi:hypothetical protein
MSPEKSKELTKRHPKIFSSEGDSREPLDYYGFECSDGWFDLIDALCRTIQTHVDWALESSIKSDEDKEYLQVRATQVKEKWGGLRFYYSGGDEYISGLVAMAEVMSSKICEDCGDKATIKTTGWIRNICHSCQVKGKFKAQGFELK